jgi:hypothetical protein
VADKFRLIEIKPKAVEDWLHSTFDAWWRSGATKVYSPVISADVVIGAACLLLTVCSDASTVTGVPTLTTALLLSRYQLRYTGGGEQYAAANRENPDDPCADRSQAEAVG